MLRRVVVTGVGLVSPVGNTTQTSWDNLLAGKSGIKSNLKWIEKHPKIPVTISGSVPEFDHRQYYNSDRQMSQFDLGVGFALRASEQAMLMAGIDKIPEELETTSGCIMGVGLGGYSKVFDDYDEFKKNGQSHIQPEILFNLSPSFVANQIAKKYHLRSINYTTISACTSGAHAIGEAFQMIRNGRLNMAIAGGCEAGNVPLPTAGFANMRALCSSFNDSPEKASRPFEKNRAGFVMGEGAGVLILEELEAAKKRGANILCEVKGYGASGDASHITAPAPGGEGAIRAIQGAVNQSGFAPEDIDYVNAHGTSTPLNDLNEGKAIRHVFGGWSDKGLMVSSTKSMTGHLLGGAGGLEAGICAMAIANKAIPPTLNYDEVDPEIILDFVPHEAREKNIRAAVSNAFGFGGTNAALLFSQFTD